jgi:DNA-directed RNA polymerase I subunit RPA49
LIPPFDTTATEPADIYPLHDIIPEAEWRALSVSAFDEGQTDRERIAMLPFRKSTWLNDHLKTLVGASGKSKKKNMCGI